MGRQWTMGDSARRRAAARRAAPIRDRVREVARRRIRTGVTVKQLVGLTGVQPELARAVLAELVDAGEARVFIRPGKAGGYRWERIP